MKKSRNNKPTRIKNTARMLECNLYFLDQVEKLQKKSIVTNNDLNNLRRDLADRKIIKLSSLWNQYLLNRIKKNIRLTNMEVGGAVFHRTFDKTTNELHFFIEVFPETTDDDVFRAFRKIAESNRKIFDKNAIQPLKEKNFMFSIKVVELYRKGFKPMEIFRQLNGEIEYTMIYRIIKKAKKGLEAK